MQRIGIIATLVFISDQLSKLVVVHWLDLQTRGVIDVYPPVLSFRMAWNQGVNFGLFANDTEILRWILIAVSVAISAWLLRWAGKQDSRLAHGFAGMVIGGAMGNVVDRLFYGAVADFLNMSCCGLNNPYAFNIADMAIFVGAFGLVLVANKLDNRT